MNDTQLAPRILVTGGGGFIGSFPCEHPLEAGMEVLCVDNFFTGTRTNVAHLLDSRCYRARGLLACGFY